MNRRDFFVNKLQFTINIYAAQLIDPTVSRGWATKQRCLTDGSSMSMHFVMHRRRNVPVWKYIETVLKLVWSLKWVAIDFSRFVRQAVDVRWCLQKMREKKIMLQSLKEFGFKNLIKQSKSGYFLLD